MSAAPPPAPVFSCSAILEYGPFPSELVSEAVLCERVAPESGLSVALRHRDHSLGQLAAFAYHAVLGHGFESKRNHSFASLTGASGLGKTRISVEAATIFDRAHVDVAEAVLAGAHPPDVHAVGFDVEAFCEGWKAVPRPKELSTLPLAAEHRSQLLAAVRVYVTFNEGTNLVPASAPSLSVPQFVAYELALRILHSQLFPLSDLDDVRQWFPEESVKKEPARRILIEALTAVALARGGTVEHPLLILLTIDEFQKVSSAAQGIPSMFQVLVGLVCVTKRYPYVLCPVFVGLYGDELRVAGHLSTLELSYIPLACLDFEDACYLADSALSMTATAAGWRWDAAAFMHIFHTRSIPKHLMAVLTVLRSSGFNPLTLSDCVTELTVEMRDAFVKTPRSPADAARSLIRAVAWCVGDTRRIGAFLSADESVGWTLETWERASGLVVSPNGSAATVPYSTLLLVAKLEEDEEWTECEHKFVGCVKYIVETVDPTVWHDIRDWSSTETFTAAFFALRVNAYLVLHIGCPGPCVVSGADLLRGAVISPAVSELRIPLRPMEIKRLETDLSNPRVFVSGLPPWPSQVHEVDLVASASSNVLLCAPGQEAVDWLVMFTDCTVLGTAEESEPFTLVLAGQVKLVFRDGLTPSTLLMGSAWCREFCKSLSSGRPQGQPCNKRLKVDEAARTPAQAVGFVYGILDPVKVASDAMEECTRGTGADSRAGTVSARTRRSAPSAPDSEPQQPFEGAFHVGFGEVSAFFGNTFLDHPTISYRVLFINSPSFRCRGNSAQLLALFVRDSLEAVAGPSRPLGADAAVDVMKAVLAQGFVCGQRHLADLCLAVGFYLAAGEAGSLLTRIDYSIPGAAPLPALVPAPAPSVPVEDMSWQAGEDFAALEAQLASQGLSGRNVEGDGNCLFRAVSDQLRNNDGGHAELRKTACGYMSHRQAVFLPFVPGNMDTYVSRMRQDREWGDQVEIVALSMALRVNVLLYRTGEIPFYVAVYVPGRRTVHLGYVSRNHYVSVRTIDGNVPFIPANAYTPSPDEMRVMQRSWCWIISQVQRALYEHGNIGAAIAALVAAMKLGGAARAPPATPPADDEDTE